MILCHLAPFRKKKWVVYAKPYSPGRKRCLRISRATPHRDAISNRRVLVFDGSQVTFRYKDQPRPSSIVLQRDHPTRHRQQDALAVIARYEHRGKKIGVVDRHRRLRLKGGEPRHVAFREALAMTTVKHLEHT